MKIAKQYLIACVFTLCMTLSAQTSDEIKQQAYGQALYERICDIIENTETSAQKTSDYLVQMIIADEAIYKILTVGKKEGYTSAELLEFAKRTAQKNEDQEAVQVLQEVEQEVSKNWFSKHPIMTLCIAAGVLYTYLRWDSLPILFSSVLESLGLKQQTENNQGQNNQGQQTEDEKRAAEQARRDQEVQRLAAELKQKEQEVAARLAAEKEAAEQEAQRLAAEKAQKEKEKNSGAPIGHAGDNTSETILEQWAHEREEVLGTFEPRIQSAEKDVEAKAHAVLTQEESNIANKIIETVVEKAEKTALGKIKEALHLKPGHHAQKEKRKSQGRPQKIVDGEAVAEWQAAHADEQEDESSEERSIPMIEALAESIGAEWDAEHEAQINPAVETEVATEEKSEITEQATFIREVTENVRVADVREVNEVEKAEEIKEDISISSQSSIS